VRYPSVSASVFGWRQVAVTDGCHRALAGGIRVRLVNQHGERRSGPRERGCAGREEVVSNTTRIQAGSAGIQTAP
jgi:hypothetical protein